MADHIHSFVDTVVPATCNEQGYTLHRCDCGYEYKDTFVPKTTHNFVFAEQTDPTCTEPGVQTFRCTICGQTATKTAPAAHKWNDWVLKTVPTCTEPGVRGRSCACCDATEEEAIAPRGHKLTNPQKKKGYIEYFCNSRY